MYKLKTIQQPHQLVVACQEAGISLTQPGEYLVNIRSVMAAHDMPDPTTCRPRFCRCSLQVVKIIKSPGVSFFKRMLGTLNADLFLVSVKDEVTLCNVLLDDQGDLQNRIHGDILGECWGLHQVDIMNARVVPCWFGRCKLIFNDKTYAVPSANQVEEDMHETESTTLA